MRITTSKEKESLMWPFKKETPETERIYIPVEHIEKVLELADAYSAKPGGQDNVATYRLWRKIYSCLNFSKDVNSVYEFNHSMATRLYIVRIDET